MPTTIKAGGITERQHLSADKKCSIVVAASSSAIVERYLDGVLLYKTTLAASTTTVFGEYLIGMALRITCLTGTLTFDILQSTTQRSAQGNAAAVGEAGEYLSASLGSGAATSLTTATPKTVISLPLTEGDWDVDGVADFIPAATTSVTALTQGASETTNTLGADDTYLSNSMAAVVFGAVTQRNKIPVQRIAVSAAGTTVYLIASATFTISTMTAFGTIRARRAKQLA